MEKHVYEYSGPVRQFGRIISDRWHGTTIATSEAKAKSNLTYQYKRQTGKIAGCKIELPGKVMIID